MGCGTHLEHLVYGLGHAAGLCLVYYARHSLWRGRGCGTTGGHVEKEEVGEEEKRGKRYGERMGASTTII